MLSWVKINYYHKKMIEHIFKLWYIISRRLNTLEKQFLKKF